MEQSGGLIEGQPGYMYPSVADLQTAPPHTINLFGYHQWDDRRTADGEALFFSSNVLPQWSGYALVIGFSLAFAVMAWALMWVEAKFSRATLSAEQFTTAGRSLKSGLIAVDVVSHWTWPINIIGAAYFCYIYGLSGALWWCGGQATCIWVFAVMSTELKIRAPNAHTILEIIRTRWGASSHLVFYFFALLTNLLVTAQQYQAMVLIVNYLTGASIYAMGFIIPAGVVLYAAVGGLKATFTTSYIHTVIFLAIVTWLMYLVFMVGGNGLLGDIDQMYERILHFHEFYPAIGNRGGSYLTGYSEGGYQSLIIFTLANLAYIFVDQSYWQSAIAAKPQAAIKGYMLGSFIFFPIAYCMAFTGLGILALDLPVSIDEAANGGGLAALSWVLAGKKGPLLVLVSASSKELVAVARAGVCAWAVISGLTVVVIFKANISLLLLNYIPGVILPSAIPGVLASLVWNRCTAAGANISAVVGCIAGTLIWLFYPTMRNYEGGINIPNLTLPEPLMAGASTAIGSSVLLLVAISLLWPDAKPFDWDVFRTHISVASNGDESAQSQAAVSQESIDHMIRMRPYVWAGAGTVFCLLIIAWPLLELIQPVMSLANFRFWIIFGVLLCTIALAVATLVPLVEARHIIFKVVRSCLGRSRAEDFPSGFELPMSQPLGTRALVPAGNGASGDVSDDDTAHGQQYDAPANGKGLAAREKGTEHLVVMAAPRN